MNTRKRLIGIWLMAMALLSLCAYTAFFVAQMWLNVLYVIYLSLAIMQVAALIIYLWGPQKLPFRPLRMLYHACCISSFLVIPSFVFIFMGLISQYHIKIPESIDAEKMPVESILPKDKTTIYNTGTVYIFFPEYSSVELVTGDRPSKSDDSITWCCGAAFQHAVSLGFSEENVEGDHAVNGAYYTSPYTRDTFGAFTLYPQRKRPCNNARSLDFINCLRSADKWSMNILPSKWSNSCCITLARYPSTHSSCSLNSSS